VCWSWQSLKGQGKRLSKGSYAYSKTDSIIITVWSFFKSGVMFYGLENGAKRISMFA